MRIFDGNETIMSASFDKQDYAVLELINIEFQTQSIQRELLLSYICADMSSFDVEIEHLQSSGWDDVFLGSTCCTYTVFRFKTMRHVYRFGCPINTAQNKLVD